ncbi:proteoglycan 4-like [Daphnia carinata]|uniref:proteoglycan 4-like n=1 Tax=Daphnia carinata TaxID=120202 RepID=UPI00257B0487|nr:proteoglycan 4-like [Daphnia carinata]
MKLLLILCAAACLTIAAGTFVDEDFTLIDEHTNAPEAVEIVRAEEVTTRKASVRVATTTSAPVAIVDAVEVTTSANKAPKTSNRPRTSGSRRKQPAKAVAVEEEESPKAEMTSPASVDTASVSILAPKNFKPTPKPSEEIPQSQGLMEFLKKRKIERIQASTTEDPFASILATATAPSTEEPVSPAGLSKDSSPVRSSSGSSKRLPTTNRRFGASPRATTAATTTTTTPATEAPTVAAVTTKRPNRFGALRNSKALSAPAVPATTTAQPATETPKPAESSRSKLFPKRPTNLRPVANSISRRKDQSTTTTEAAPAPEVVEEDVIVPVPEELAIIAEPTTAAPLRRTRGRIAPRVSGI